MFGEACAEFAGRFAPLDAPCVSCQCRVTIGRSKMRQYLLAQISAAFAHQQAAVFSVHGVSARCFGQVVDYCRVNLWRQIRPADNVVYRVTDVFCRQLCMPVLP